MIDKETWKIGADHDKIEKIIKYNMYVQYHKTLWSNLKQFTDFFYEW